MSPLVIVSLLLAFAVCYILGGFAFSRDNANEEKHKHYIELAAILKQYGLKAIPAILTDLAVGDISGAVREVSFWAKLIKQDPTAVVKELDVVFDRVLEHKLSLPAELALLKAKIEAVGKSV